MGELKGLHPSLVISTSRSQAGPVRLYCIWRRNKLPYLARASLGGAEGGQVGEEDLTLRHQIRARAVGWESSWAQAERRRRRRLAVSISSVDSSSRRDSIRTLCQRSRPPQFELILNNDNSGAGKPRLRQQQQRAANKSDRLCSGSHRLQLNVSAVDEGKRHHLE